MAENPKLRRVENPQDLVHARNHFISRSNHYVNIVFAKYFKDNNGRAMQTLL